MRLSRYYQEDLFSSTFFLSNILPPQQQYINSSNIYDVRTRTSLQNISLRRDTSLSKEEKKDIRRFALAPQLDALPQKQGTSAESNNTSKFQASNATSGSACL